MVMRIITRLAGGGPPVHATLLNRYLPAHGFRSLLVYGSCGDAEKNVESLLLPGEQAEKIPELGASPSPLHDLIALYKLWLLIRKHRPDIVHTHTAKAGLLGRLAALMAGCTCIVHTYHGHVLEGYFPSWISRLLRWTESFMAKGSRALITVSAQQANELAETFRVAEAGKFRVVPLGTQLDPFLEVPAPDWHAPVLKLLWLGRFVPIKNLPLLLEIAAECRRLALPVEFCLAGDGPLRHEIVESAQARSLNNVTFVPWQEDIRPSLAAAHALIMTSHREGTPLSLIQGMAAGRPFISTPAGGTVDLGSGLPKLESVRWWYDNAVLVTPQARAFAETIEGLLARREKLKSMGASARKFAIQRYSSERLTVDIAQLYTELLAEKRAFTKTEEVAL
jgi:glycosyltransferase involved in cell wall biosynthesis